MRRVESGGNRAGKWSVVQAPPGDPRRPSEVRKYNRPVVNADTQPPEPLLFVALFCGMMALVLKMKIAAWGSLFCCISALANMKSESMDFKQLVSSVTFAVMGLVACYLVPIPPSARKNG